MAPTNVCSKIPPEIDDYIISFLADDLRTLLVCALVCKAWLRASRIALYSDIRIGTESQFDAFRKTAGSSPYIQERVHILRIHTIGWIDAKFPQILEFLALLVKLRVFEVIDTDGGQAISSLQGFCLSETVSRLSFISCQMSPAELCCFISAFPSLEDLHIEWKDSDILFNNHLVVGGNCSPPKLQLTRLSLLSGYDPCGTNDDFYDRLLQMGIERTLRELAVILSKRNMTKCARLLKATGSRLEKLELSSVLHYGTLPRDEEEIGRTIDLGANTGLKSLTFTGIFSLTPVVFTLLSQVRAPYLQQLSYRMKIYKDVNVDRLDHVGLLRRLEEKNLESVKVFQLLYWGDVPYEDVLRRVNETYYTLAGRVTLAVKRTETLTRVR